MSLITENVPRRTIAKAGRVAQITLLPCPLNSMCAGPRPARRQTQENICQNCNAGGNEASGADDVEHFLLANHIIRPPRKFAAFCGSRHNHH